MESKSVKKYVGIPRRKIARLANECKNMKINLAKAKLSFMPQEAARELLKTIRSAEGNFLVKNPNFNTDNLKVKSILVDVGPSMKRSMPKARGSADAILKRSSHISVVLTDEQ